MSSRLQVLVPESLDAQLRKAAQRGQVSVGEFVRRAIERALVDDRFAADPVARLASLGGPTGDIDEMLADIEAGRR
ncbi:MAG: ribbon-helix-helix protein, CopG family [Acidobacteriota bacterium]